MKTRLNAILAATAVALAVAGHAQAQQPAAPSTQSAGAESASAAVFTDGEVRKVDKDARKVTIKHGEIKNLDMPPMTMVFAVKDDAVLDEVKAGDKIQFKAVDDGGKLTVVEIQAAR
jgi:Cu(I)/Ag(I) efflux system protein CusF